MNKKLKIKSKILSLFITFLIIFAQFHVYDVKSASSGENFKTKDYINLSKIIMNSSGNEGSTGKTGDEFAINYTITPNDISTSRINKNNKPKEIVLVVDTSGSMNYGLNGEKSDLSRLSIVKAAANNFLNKFKNDSNVKIGLIEYADKAYEINNLNSERSISQIKEQINSFQAGGGTNIGDGLRIAYNMLYNSENSNVKKYIVLLTDGLPNMASCKYNMYGYKTMEFLDVLNSNSYYSYVTDDGDSKGIGLNYSKFIGEKIKNDKNITSFMIGFTKDTSGTKLQQIASSSGGEYRQANDDTALNDIYSKIADRIRSDFSLNNIHFEETFPENITISGVPDGLQISGQKVSGNISDINYNMDSSKEAYKSNKINFSIKVKVNKEGKYSLSSSSFIKYLDLDGSYTTIDFNKVDLSIQKNNTVNEAPIVVDRSLDKSQYILKDNTSGDIKMTYTITPRLIGIGDIDNNNRDKDKEIVVVVDTSGSMDYKLDGSEARYSQDKTRMGILKETLISKDNNGFIDKFQGSSNVKIALVSYNTKADIKNGFVNMNNSDQLSNLKGAVSNLNAKGATNTGDGLRRAYWILKNSPNIKAEKYIVLMTDGAPTGYSCDYNNNSWYKDVDFKYNDGDADEYYYSNGEEDIGGNAILYSKNMASKISNDNLKINSYVVGFSNGINSNKLQQISSSLKGVYKEAKTADDIKMVYDKIANEIKMDIPITQLMFRDIFPEGITPIKVLKDKTEVSGFEINSQEISGSLEAIGNLSYKLNEKKTQYESKPIIFDLILKGNKTGKYTVGGKDGEGNYNSTLSYTDINKSTTRKVFPDKNLEILLGVSPIIKQGIFVNGEKNNNVEVYLKANGDGSVSVVNQTYCKLGVLVDSKAINTNIRIDIDTNKISKMDLNYINVEVYKVGNDGDLIKEQKNNISKVNGYINVVLKDPSKYIITYSTIPNIEGIKEDTSILNKVSSGTFSESLKVNIKNFPEVK